MFKGRLINKGSVQIQGISLTQRLEPQSIEDVLLLEYPSPFPNEGDIYTQPWTVYE